MMAITLEVLERNLAHVPPHEDVWITHNVSRGMGAAAADPTLQRSPATVIIHTTPMVLRDWAGFYTAGLPRGDTVQPGDPDAGAGRAHQEPQPAGVHAGGSGGQAGRPAGAEHHPPDTEGNVTENKGGNFLI